MARKLLLALVASTAISVSPAIAADVAPPEEPVPGWTGFYIGAGAGYAWANFDVDLEQFPLADPDETNSADLDDDDFLGTIQAGFDWQFAENFVVGIMGDWAFANLNDEERNPACYTVVVCDQDPFEGQIFGAGTRDMVTVSGRFGFLFTPSVLAYGLVGWTWADVKNSYFEGCEGLVPGPCDNIDYDKEQTADGLTVGGGVEALFTDNVSGRLEYRFTDLDEVDHGEGNAARTANTSVDSEVHSIRATLNVRFGNLF